MTTTTLHVFAYDGSDFYVATDLDDAAAQMTEMHGVHCDIECMEQMADGRLGNVTPLRKGDMLQDFYGEFQIAHGAVRERLRGDTAVMDRFAEAWGGAPGDASAAAIDELDELRRHVAARKKALG